MTTRLDIDIFDGSAITQIHLKDHHVPFIRRQRTFSVGLPQLKDPTLDKFKASGGAFHLVPPFISQTVGLSDSHFGEVLQIFFAHHHAAVGLAFVGENLPFLSNFVHEPDEL